MVGLSFYLRIAQKRNFIMFDSYSKVLGQLNLFFSVEAQVQALHCPSSVTEGSSVNLKTTRNRVFTR